MSKYHQPNDLQRSRPCFAVLHPTAHGFYGRLSYEDSEHCWIVIDWASPDRLEATLRRAGGPYPLQPQRIVLHRNASKCHAWQSDFVGQLLRKGRLYRAGVRLCTSRAGNRLAHFFPRPDFSTVPGLEVVEI